MKQLLKSITAILLVCCLAFMPAFEARAAMFESDDWDPFTKQAINDLITYYNHAAGGGSPYVVLDFDNTISIFNVQEQLAIYQLQTMSFAFTPEELPAMFRANLLDPDRDVSSYGLGPGTYNDWILDIEAAYTKLYETYGPFTAAGVDTDTQFKLQSDDVWQEFATKMRCLYWLIYSAETANVVYPWIDSWFVGMTKQEVYDLAARSHNTYRMVETHTVTWKSPDTITSRVGVVEFTWTSGVSVPNSFKLLFEALQSNGFDIWIVSESHIDVIRAAIDVFGLHNNINGLIAMTHATKDGKYINKYDYLTGYPAIAEAGGLWSDGTLPTRSTTQGAGKVTAINNTLYRRYGHGPVAGFMDSTGDFDFCTMYNTMKLVVCFNRLKKVTDGGGLVSEISLYQQIILDYDLLSANAKGDTLYCLQGRDENGFRRLRSTQESIMAGSTVPIMYGQEENMIQLQYFMDHSMTTKDICDTFAFRTPAEKSELGFAYGFMLNYDGYHTIK